MWPGGPPVRGDPAPVAAWLDGTTAERTAETGTIIVDSGPDHGRPVLSLLPDLHLSVVRASQVVGSAPVGLRGSVQRGRLLLPMDRPAAPRWPGN